MTLVFYVLKISIPCKYPQPLWLTKGALSTLLTSWTCQVMWPLSDLSIPWTQSSSGWSNALCIIRIELLAAGLDDTKMSPNAPISGISLQSDKTPFKSGEGFCIPLQLN